MFEKKAEIILANPRGFCAGVDRAIAIVEQVLARYPSPVYVRHEVVHNRTVVENLKRKGAVFIENLEEVPHGAVLIFSAHGVSKAVREEANLRGLTVFDATCPLVTKVHVEVSKMAQKSKKIIMIGHAGHPEVEGTMGQIATLMPNLAMELIEKPADVARLSIPADQPLGYVTQTTLSLDDTAEVIAALKQKFPHIDSPKKEDICYATQNRQESVKVLAAECDLILVIGSANSSNSNRLREVAEKMGCPAYLLDTAAALPLQALHDKKKIGITAGASAPESLVQDLIARLYEWGEIHHTTMTMRDSHPIDEGMHFPLPASLSQ